MLFCNTTQHYVRAICIHYSCVCKSTNLKCRNRSSVHAETYPLYLPATKVICTTRDSIVLVPECVFKQIGNQIITPVLRHFSSLAAHAANGATHSNLTRLRAHSTVNNTIYLLSHELFCSRHSHARMLSVEIYLHRLLRKEEKQHDGVQDSR